MCRPSQTPLLAHAAELLPYSISGILRLYRDYSITLPSPGIVHVTVLSNQDEDG